MSYLYSKLPETGVPHRIGTGGSRQMMPARGHVGRVGERLVGHAKKQRVGLPVDLVPVLEQQRSLYRVAPKPEVVVAHASLFQQRFSGGESRLLIRPLVLHQGEETVEYRANKPRSGLLRNLSTLAGKCQCFCSQPP